MRGVKKLVRATSQLSLLDPVVMVEKVPSAATPAGVKLYAKVETGDCGESWDDEGQVHLSLPLNCLYLSLEKLQTRLCHRKLQRK